MCRNKAVAMLTISDFETFTSVLNDIFSILHVVKCILKKHIQTPV